MDPAKTRIHLLVPLRYHQFLGWGEDPIAISSQPDSFNAMEPTRSTDYLGVIPNTYGAGLFNTNQPSGAKLLPALLKDATPAPASSQAFHDRAGAALSLAALVFTAATVVVMVIINWSR